MNKPRYPNITVQIIGRDGNAIAILGAVKRELRRAGISTSEQERFWNEATAGDYNDLLNTVQEWVNVK